MKSKKIIGILVVVLVAVTFLGIASAAEVTVGSQHFNLPDGFKENTTAAKEKVSSSNTPGSTATKTYVKSFYNGDKSVMINVIELPAGSKLVLKEESGFVNRTINGVDGVYNPDTHQFKYGNGSNIIHIAASGDSILEDFVMA